MSDEPTGASPHAERAGRPDGELEFGPSGYLPERASKRARKIVLRAPLGAQWIVASVVAGLIVVVAGVWWLLTADEPPPEPWVALGPIEALEDAAFDERVDALIVAAGGRIRAFTGADHVSYCDASNRLEAADGRTWSLTGRGAGTASLDEHPTLVQGGELYVDPTRTSPGPDPAEAAIDPACV